jgi:FG-GAP repeat
MPVRWWVLSAALITLDLCAPSLAEAQTCPPTRAIPSISRDFDHFGRTLSLDNNILAVGASEFDGSATDSGAVFIFQLNAGDWTQTAILEPSNTNAQARFGESVSLSGNTLAIGAFGDADKGPKAGAVYIYTLAAGQWAQTAKLTAANTAAGDRFGSSVSLAGDLLVVGAPYADALANNAGAAYVFRRTNNIWSQEARLDATLPNAGDLFGHAVDTDSTRILVGAYLDDERGTDSGSATVFALQQGTWQPQAHLVPADGNTNDWFGHNQVAIEGNLLAIGAPGDDDRGTNSGSAYVYTFTANTWQLQQKLAPPQLGPTDSFGKSLALDQGSLLVGARLDDTLKWNAGAAYLFTLVNNQWRQRAMITAQTSFAGAEFGRGVALGQGHLAVGGHKFSLGGQPELGAAWVFNLDQCQTCYADCDQSTGLGTLDVFDFLCFQSSFVTSQTYACDCDTSTGPATCDVFDFLCFQNAFVTGCP